jgi:O-antigen/teichoic acid export membrane protein
MFSFLRLPGEHSLSRGALTAFGIRVSGAGLLYGLHVLLAQWMGADGYGAYVFAISWASVLAQLGALGLPNAALRFVPAYHTRDEPGALQGFLWSGRLLILGATALLALLAAATAYLLPRGTVPLLTLLVGFGLAPLLALVMFETQVLRACNQFALSYGPKQVLRPLGVGAGVGGLFWLTGSVSALAVLLCTGLVFVGMVFIQQWGTRHTLPALRDAVPISRTRRWLRVALPLLLTSGFQLVLQKTDVLLIGPLVGAREVGIYYAAMRTAQVVTFTGFAVDAVAAPLVSRLYHGDDGDLQTAVSTLAHWYFWPTLAVALGLLLLAAPLLSLFGPGFTAGRPVLYAFLAGLLVNAATGAQTHLLTLTGHERSCAYIFGWCALLNVVLNVAGIYASGALGAALATATALAVRNLWVRHHVVRLTGIRPSIVAALQPSASSHA